MDSPNFNYTNFQSKNSLILTLKILNSIMLTHLKNYYCAVLTIIIYLVVGINSGNAHIVLDKNNEETLKCTDAERRKINEFNQEIDKFQDILDDEEFTYNPTEEKYEKLAAWREALVACNYSLNDVPTLLANLSSKNKNTRAVAEDVFIEMDLKALPALLAALKKDDTTIRNNAIEVLTSYEMSIGDERYTKSLANALKEDNQNFRISVLSIIITNLENCRRGEVNDEILFYSIAENLDNKNPKIRTLAATILYNSEYSEKILDNYKNSPDQNTRQRAAEIIKKIEQEPKIAVGISCPSRIRDFRTALLKYFANQHKKRRNNQRYR
ncbi:HEAT repeat domain-containing protein [Nostoc favosum]|uniref:HEAT repeat domain-containing protein n=1 Tax=Nostoc favosum CHAB5714 TaxID=2780399 RepID=A0ABS8IAQ6_9NOSO|nr:HEAT repeat domain-containing protein [Nostoc favosum]MCC5601298.1 hypothetical protein [Nostoc favosum CHAB5714]